MQFQKIVDEITSALSVEAHSEIAEAILGTSLCLGARSDTTKFRHASVVDEAKRNSWTK